jgi:hypothetical protein
LGRPPENQVRVVGLLLKMVAVMMHTQNFVTVVLLMLAVQVKLENMHK